MVSCVVNTTLVPSGEHSSAYVSPITPTPRKNGTTNSKKIRFGL